jgi:hypothetical protein
MIFGAGGLALLIGIIVFLLTGSLVWAIVAALLVLVLAAPAGAYGDRYHGPRFGRRRGDPYP